MILKNWIRKVRPPRWVSPDTPMGGFLQVPGPALPRHWSPGKIFVLKGVILPSEEWVKGDSVGDVVVQVG